MSKVNAIRKKAIELARKQDWPGAIKEYKRLAEADQANPNVYNELGDIYLKTGNKVDAYKAFVSAIDAYAQVSLHNNAVAVCKKVLRVIPARFEVLVKLGTIRARQGLGREAESFYKSFLEKAAMKGDLDAAELAHSTALIAEEMPESATLLQYAADCLIKHSLNGEAGELLLKALPLHQQRGDAAAATQARESLEALGMADQISDAVPDTSGAPEGPVITEDNLWTEAHSNGDRIEVEAGSAADVPDAVPIGEETADATDGAEFEYGADANATVSGDAAFESPPDLPEVDLEGTGSVDGTEEGFDLPSPEAETTEAVGEDHSPDPGVEEEEQLLPDTSYEDLAREIAAEIESLEEDHSDAPAADPVEESVPYEQYGSESGTRPEGDADSIHVSMIVDEIAGETSEQITDEDFRSHYDMGMAYIEMELYEEALREYQFAAKSPQYTLRSIEMIGLCFLRQGKAHLAIKQLTRGLEFVRGDEMEALGIKYNLGLAHELVGDFEGAKSQFEDVYMADVTFREVAEKVAQYT